MQNNKFIKYLSALVIIVVVFLLGISIGKEYQAPRDNTAAQTQNQSGVASLMIDYGNGKVETYPGLAVINQMTVFDLLKSAVDSRQVAFEYKDYGGGMGMFIETIGGIGKDPAGKKWWQYWVNNTYSQVGAGSYKVRPNDVVEFKFTEGKE